MNTPLKRYPSYKLSGVPWLGEVPDHWEVWRLKGRVANVIDQRSDRSPNEIYIALEHVESWTGRIQRVGESHIDSQVKRFRKGDVLFGKLRPYLAKITRLDCYGVCVGEFLVFRPRSKDLDSAYLEPVLRSKPFVEAVNASTFGAKMPRAEWSFIGNMKLPYPPAREQTAVVRYLHHVEQRIQCYIEAKEKLISLLEEQKQAVIHQAVTGQIDARTGQRYPAYKDSGVEWLGDVPAHWQIAALHHRYSQCLGKMLDSKRITGNHLLPYLRNVDVQWDQINTMDLPTMDIAPEEYERYTVQDGDLLVCEGGEIGRCALWSGGLPKCGFQKALHRLRPRNACEDKPRYMCYALRAAAKADAFNDGHLSTIGHLTGEKLRVHRFPFPPVAEQELLVRYLDGVVEQIDHTVSCVHRQIDLLQEYRTCLIANVVTGKLDVRKVVAELPEKDDSGDGKNR